MFLSRNNSAKALLLGILMTATSKAGATRLGSPSTTAYSDRELAVTRNQSAACCDAPSGRFDCCDPEWIELETTATTDDNSVLAVYQVSVREQVTGCSHSSQGRVLLSCPVGLTLMSPAIENGSPHQDCELKEGSTKQAECDLLRERPLRVGCYGPTDADVLLQVSVDSFLTGLCNETLNVVSVWPLVATYGGESSYQISMASQCGDVTNANTATVSAAASKTETYQPITNFDCNGDLTGLGSSRTCGMGSSCSDTYACTLSYVWGIGTIPICVGSDICNGTYTPVTMTAGAAPCPNQAFVTGVPNGQAWNVNANCESGICIVGKCAATTAAANETCLEDADCGLGACGKETFDPNDNQVCCYTGERVHFEPHGLEYCTGQAPNASCGLNTMCQSQICSFGECRATHIPDREPCEEGWDCNSGVCAIYFPDKSWGCCPEGGTITREEQINGTNTVQVYCTDLRNGSSCLRDTDCNSNVCVFGLCQGQRQADTEPCEQHHDCESRICGLEEAKEDAPAVCCPNGKAKVYDVSWTYTDHWICVNLTVGQSCVEDLQCMSGSCLEGECQATRAGDLATCDSNGDCVSGVCARAESKEDSPLVCCIGGDAKVYDVSWDYTDHWICSHIDVGGACEDDFQCESGVCIEKTCRQGRQNDLEGCDSNNDCIKGLCALAFSSETAPMVCCPGGNGKAFDVDWSYSDPWICMQLETGQPCEADAQCQSGVCFNKQCGEGRKADLEACDSANDCIGGMCGLAEARENAPYICCQNGKALYLDVNWDYSDFWICMDIPEGGSCLTDASCQSGVCYQFKCMAGRQADLQPCDSHVDCISGGCGKNEFTELAPTVCCPGGQVELLDVDWDYNDEYFCSSSEPVVASRQEGESCDVPADCHQNSITCAYDSFSEQGATNLICCSESFILDVPWDYRDQRFCGNRPLGTTCVDDRVCSSALCIGGVCSEERLADGEGCTEHNDCGNRTCAANAYSEFADNICCSAGLSYLLDVDWTYKDVLFCANLGIGATCGDDRMCEGGLTCVNSVCTEERLQDESACTKHSDCDSRQCARQGFSEFSESMCCESGEAYLLDVDWTYKDILFCGNRDEGTPCGDSRVCGNGLFCVDSVCSAERLNDLESCTHSSQCQSRACGFNSFSEFADSICCEGGEMYSLDVPWTYKDLWFCGHLPVDTICGDDRMCQTNICISGECKQNRLQDGDECTKHSDCQNGACALDDFGEFASKRCCKEGEMHELDVPWTYQDYWFCGNLDAGKACSIDHQCSSKVCVGSGGEEQTTGICS